jgi:predicted small metal-binding protein
MKTFTCAKMGNNCTTVLKARTEERLSELASIHLREAHGIVSLSQDTVAQIKDRFSNLTVTDSASAVDRIFEKYNCNSDPDCTWRYIAEAEMILTGDGNVHARELKAA